jgi:TonB family protein
MRILLHGTTRSTALSPSAAVSIAAHAAIIGGAMYGNGRVAPRSAEAERERILYQFVPPPDRAPQSRASERQLRYVPGRAGSPEAIAPSVKPGPTGRGGAAASAAVAQSSGELTAKAMTLPLASADDSVYSVLSVDDSAARDLSSAAPIYPTELLAKLVAGRVTARYVIDSSGRPEAASAEIISATHDEFARAVREALPRMRFQPGKVAGRHVRQLVEQEFLFRITPPAPAAADNTRAHPPA